MKLYIFRFSASDLKKLPPKHRGLLIASAHCVNELLSVALYTILEQRAEGLTEGEGSLLTIRQMTLLRFQASKILEFRNLASKWLSLIKDDDQDLFESAIVKLKPVTERVAQEGWIRTLRDRSSFHYDLVYAEDSLATFKDNASLSFVAGAIQSANAFSFAEEIMSTPVFREAGEGDIGRGINALADFAHDLQRPIIDFTAWIIGETFNRAGIKFSREKSSIRDALCADESTPRIPLIFARKQDRG